MLLLKIRNYERKLLFYILTFLYLICFLVFVCFLIFNKYFTYITYEGVVSNKDVIFMVSDKELKYFYDNSTLLNDAKEKKFTISKVYKNILKKNNVQYHQIVVNFKFSSQYKDNDVLTVSLHKRKERLINIFKNIWKEE